MMKKITLLFALLITSLGFSQELLTNGDFSSGTASWIGTGPFSVVSGEGYFSSTNSGGNPWDTQLVQGSLAFTSAHEYTLTFKARAAANRTITVAIQNVGIWDDQFRQDFNLTTTMQTFTATFNATSTNGNVQIGFLMGGTSSTDAVYYDDVSLFKTGNVAETCSDGIMNQDETGIDCGGSCPNACPSPPATAAPTPPARDLGDVISVFSGAYTDVTVSGVNTFAGASWDNFTIELTDDTKRLTAPNPGGGVQFEYIGVPPLDLTDFTHMHVDFYVEGAATPGSVFQIFLINFPNHPAGDASYNLNTQFEITVVGSGAWVSGDVELSTFINGGAARDKIALVQLVAAGPAYGPIYIDNIYFHKNTTLGTEDFKIAGLNVYPNPTKDSWSIKTNNERIASIQVYDILGKNVLSLSPNANETKIDASKLKSGLYFAKIATDNGSSSIKLIKN